MAGINVIITIVVYIYIENSYLYKCVIVIAYIICTDTQENADRATKMVTVQYSSQTKPLLTIADAIKANSIYGYPGEANVLNVGDANGAFATYSSYMAILCVVN